MTRKPDAMTQPTASTGTNARTFMGVTLDRLSPGDSRGKYAAFTAQRWVFGDTVEGIKEAIRQVQGVSRRPNGHTYSR